MTKARIKKITNFITDFDKSFEVKDWENGEGVDIIVEDVVIAVPLDKDRIIRFTTKELAET